MYTHAKMVKVVVIKWHKLPVPAAAEHAHLYTSETYKSTCVKDDTGTDDESANKIEIYTNPVQISQNFKHVSKDLFHLLHAKFHFFLFYHEVTDHADRELLEKANVLAPDAIKQLPFTGRMDTLFTVNSYKSTQISSQC